MICWPDSGEIPAVKPSLLDDDTMGKGAPELEAPEQLSKVGLGSRRYWKAGFQIDNRRVGAIDVSLNLDSFTNFGSYLTPGQMEVTYIALCAIEVTLQLHVPRAEALLTQVVTTVVVFSG
jgi:hypothetical protein